MILIYCIIKFYLYAYACEIFQTIIDPAMIRAVVSESNKSM